MLDEILTAWVVVRNTFWLVPAGQVARPTGGVAIMDLGSKFGTHLDGRRRAMNGFGIRWITKLGDKDHGPKVDIENHLEHMNIIELRSCSFIFHIHGTF